MAQVYRNAGIEAEKIAASSPEFMAVAERTKAAILAAAAPHNKTGQYSGSIRISEGRSEKSRLPILFVYSVDPNAMQIEYGHQWVTPDGKVLGYIDGLFIFNKAFNVMKAGG